MKKTAFILTLGLILVLSTQAFCATQTAGKTVKKTPVVKKAPAPKPTPVVPVVAPVYSAPAIPNPVVKKVEPISTPANNWLIKAGVFGSAGNLNIGYQSVLNDKVSLLVAAGYGSGNNYTVVTWSNTLIYKPRADKNQIVPFFGLGVNYSDFSKQVIDVPGINTINQGPGIGGAVLVGLARDCLFVQAGYDSRTGAMADIGYSFGK